MGTKMAVAFAKIFMAHIKEGTESDKAEKKTERM